MSIEKIDYKTYSENKKTQEALHTENVEEHLCALAEQLFIKEQEVGFGNFAHVYRDTEAGLAYKRIKPGHVPKNDVHEEARYLAKLTQTSEEVIVPLPVASFVVTLKRERDGRMAKQNVLIMQEIEGYSLSRFLPKNPGEKPELVLPNGFNPDKFFGELRKFVKSMHDDHGIYHRDLFARNVMLEKASMKPVLIDFGDAVEFDERFAEAGELDAYGRQIVEDTNGNLLPREDLDLKNLKEIEQEIRRVLDI